MVRGLQGAPGSREFLDASHVLATAKHFIGDGGTADGVDRGDTRGSEADLLQHSRAGLRRGDRRRRADGHGVVQQLERPEGARAPAPAHGRAEEAAWASTASSSATGTASTKCRAARRTSARRRSTPASTWSWCRPSGSNFLDNTLDQVRAEKIPMARIDDAVTRILRVKYRAGLFEKGRPSSRPLANKRELLGAPEHRDAGAAGGARIAGAAQERARRAAAAAQVARARRRRRRRQHLQADRRLDADLAGHRKLQRRLSRARRRSSRASHARSGRRAAK